MYIFAELLEEEINKYRTYLSYIKKVNLDKIEGSLIIRNKSGKIEYYHQYYKDNEKIRKYIKDEKIASYLATKSFYTKVVSDIEKRLKLLEDLYTEYKKEDPSEYFSSLAEDRKKLIHPIIPLEEQVVSKWYEKKHVGKGFDSDSILIETKNGERVRSKTEKILCDMFYDNNILYKYECPLVLSNATFYPDFTFISPKTNKEIYWEHFGRMDDGKYVNSAIKKIKLYEKNQIFLGQNLIVTFESSNQNLDYEWASDLIHRFLIK